jgi:hypothetical protein
MPDCIFCGKDVEVIVKIGRLDECQHCGHYIHCCMQCIFYDRSYHNHCRETEAPRIADKEAANFCEFFRFGRDAKKEKAGTDEAKRKLEALFGKKAQG